MTTKMNRQITEYKEPAKRNAKPLGKRFRFKCFVGYNHTTGQIVPETFRQDGTVATLLNQTGNIKLLPATVIIDYDKRTTTVKVHPAWYWYTGGTGTFLLLWQAG